MASTSAKHSIQLQNNMFIELSRHVAPRLEIWRPFIFSMKKHIDPAPLKNCEDIFDIFERLETEGSISLGNYQILSDTFMELKHDICKNIVDEYTNEIQEKNFKKRDMSKLSWIKWWIPVLQMVLLIFLLCCLYNHWIEGRCFKPERDFATIKSEFMESLKGEVEKQINSIQKKISVHFNTPEDAVMTKASLSNARDIVMNAIKALFANNNMRQFTSMVYTKKFSTILGDTLYFDTMIKNVGSAFDSMTGKFSCPNDGMYFVIAMINCDPNIAIETEIAWNDRHFPEQLTFDEPKPPNQVIHSGAIVLLKGDTLRIKVTYVEEQQNQSKGQIENFSAFFAAFRIGEIQD